MVDRSQLEAALAAVIEDLRSLDRQFALVGGLAVSLHAEVRFTRDVDIVVAVNNDEDAESLVHDLGTRGYRVVATVEQKAVSRLATARLLSCQGNRASYQEREPYRPKNSCIPSRHYRWPATNYNSHSMSSI